MTARTTASRSASTQRRSRTREDAQARDDIINMLKDDHKRVKKAFRDFEKLDHEDEEQVQALVQRTITELEVHAELEEEHFYPAARNALSEEDMVDEAEVEHMTFKVIEQLKGMEPGDDKYAATFTVLGEYVKHHVKEEENEMFKDLGRARIDWANLKAEMLEARQELMVDKGLAAAEDDAQAEDGAQQAH